MSLINDAVRAAQRERDGQKVGEAARQVGEGFFPYVDASTREPARRSMSFVVIGFSVVVLAVAGWLMWPAGSSVPPAQSRSPIVLPPRVAQASPVRVPDSATFTSPASGGNPLPQPSSRESSPAAPAAPAPGRRESVNPTHAASIVSPRAAEAEARDDSIVRVVRESQVNQTATRPNYEAEATALFDAGDLVAARERFRLAIRNAPSARAWTNYGVTLQRLGDNAAAAAAYQSAIGIDANYLEGWLYRARLAVEMGDVAAAVPMLERALSINPRHPDVNVELARLAYEEGNYTQARKFSTDALRADPSSWRAYWYSAVASDQLKDVDSATQAYAAFIDHAGDARDQAKFVGWARMRLAELRKKP